MDQAGEEGKLVETGTFRVDAGRMLQVLSKYQLATPLHALRELVRCAVLSGAAELRISEAGGSEGKGFNVRFGGRPFGPGALADVYAPLLSGDQGRGRHLAAALLAISGTGPARLAVASGQASAELAGPGRTEVPGAGAGTSLLALWSSEPPGLGLRSVMDFPLASEAALACCPVTVAAGELECPGFSRRAKPDRGLFFEEEGRRGFLEPLLEDGNEPLNGSVPAAVSTVGVHAAGVYAETFKLELGCAPVLADIGDDALLLDASMSGCVRDERFAALKPLLVKKAQELYLKEADRQKLDLSAIGRRLGDDGFRRLWRERMSEPSAWEARFGPPPAAGFLGRLWKAVSTVGRDPFASYFRPALAGDLALVGEAGRRTWWLQDACRRALLGALRTGASPGLEWLRTVPVMFSTLGEPLSLAKLRKRRSSGLLKVSTSHSAEQDTGLWGASDAVWLASRRDKEFLRAVVPEDNWRE